MKRAAFAGLIVAAGTVVILAIGCGNEQEPSVASTPEGTLSPDAAVYLSLGDSIQYGCCDPLDPERSAHPVFASYLSERLNRPVQWVTLAGNDTTTQFIEGFGGTESPQLVRAIALLEEFAQQGRPVVAVTLSIGGNDLLEFGQSCSPGVALPARTGTNGSTDSLNATGSSYA